ncbi:hypothetical protein [Aquimarina sp. 2304DJ70-9]|uniref:hypothetical protein n=1 Tax=Aquimarina penaris TaxID=3231044 RepID=UPI003461CB6A
MKIKNKIGELFFQIIPVMIGVYLGFVVSSWSERREQNSKKKILAENIISEIKENKNNVLEVVEYHKMLRDSSRYYLNSDITTTASFFRGINTPSLVNSAYETGIQTGLLNELSIDRIQSLNRVYKTQNTIDNFTNIMLTGLVSMDLGKDKKSTKKILNFLSITMEDVALLENQLINDYNHVLNNMSDNK